MGRKDGRLEEVRYNNNGEEMRIVRYGGVMDIDIQFDDGTVVEHKHYCAFKKGQIKNPMTPSVFGVGFIGVGKFKTCDENGKPTKCYKVWQNILRRCYDLKCQEKHPSYKGCTVCEEWWNFQVFAEWYYSHFYEVENEQMALDKDILHKGNKVYSPENCVFVPTSINSLFIKSNKTRGNFPIGVSKYGNKFKACLSKGNGKSISLGYFTTANEAFLAYKQAKEQFIKEVAEKYKGKIPQKLYDAMIAYEVEIDD